MTSYYLHRIRFSSHLVDTWLEHTCTTHFFKPFVNFRSGPLRRNLTSIYISTETRITGAYFEFPTLIDFKQAKHIVD
mgnify:FL=1